MDEVAAYFAISVQTVYRLLDEGDLTATSIRSCRRLSMEKMKRFEASLPMDDDMLWSPQFGM